MSYHETRRHEGVGTDDAPYTRHMEPPHVGGQPYIRCRECGAELLTCLGGWDKLAHCEECSYAEAL